MPWRCFITWQHTGQKPVAGVAWTRFWGRARIPQMPEKCAVAVFVGTEFDSITGRGGADGTPLRRTPWGELAFQLGGEEAFAIVAKHDAEFTEPKGDVIEKFLPSDRPCLILLDEVLNYFSTYRARGYHNKMYNFIQSLSETVRGRHNTVLVGSLPKSELSYTADDEADQQRLKNLLDRLGKAVILSAESETSEIIRRRLFEWDEKQLAPDGRVLLTKDAEDTCKAYAEWIQEHRQQLPSLINPDLARDQFRSTYPFHPMVISVFERKWQTLPRFQQTRGILRLLALWVSRVYQDGYKGAQRDALITLGSAPLEDQTFRAAVFEQLGETRLEGAVTTDIAGNKGAHAIRLDSEATDEIKKAKLHRRAASTIFFESNGGVTGAKAQLASVPEIRLAICDPECEIGNVETVLDALTESCYYLNVERSRYRFTLKENLNKRFADRRATIQNDQIDAEVKQEIQKIFAAKDGAERVFFPEKSIQVADRPTVMFVIADLNRTMAEEKTTKGFVEQITNGYGTSSRQFKSALIWMVAESAQPMRDEARKLLAWQAIQDEVSLSELEESQRRILQENQQKARRDLKECVWRSYKHVLLLDKSNQFKILDLGLVHSSSAASPIANILNRLAADGDVEKGVSPNFLVRNWPGFKEWSTKSVRDAFYASPLFPRILDAERIKETISRGVSSGALAYVGKGTDGKYKPFIFAQALEAGEVEFSDEMYIITAESAREYQESAKKQVPVPETKSETPTNKVTGGSTGLNTTGGGSLPGFGDTAPTVAAPKTNSIPSIHWSGEIPPQKWMNFYTKVLSRLVTTPGIKLTVSFEYTPSAGVTPQTVEETKTALRELGLKADIES